MNPLLAPLRLFVRSLNLLPGVSASLRTGHVEVEDRPDAGGRRVLLVRRGQDVAAVRRAVTVRAEGVERTFDLPFDPTGADRRVSNGVLTVDIE